ncbi:T9SS type A sorting domain-containing protein [Hymenobacter jeollabukensis]|uniref:T9SS type A sorting domain-containing protein n=1 Tax=Hymenobacter jeollabukensis TaxID=2025313 RepID=A0A5R8WSM0_9BACT|nr:T9SS type A sorting domain-containing protein [Hymenobacter jeollabukensis]TLM94162.1 T9SS type A sorting domain-containing protein [Hymenobacter jeollabukensis]
MKHAYSLVTLGLLGLTTIASAQTLTNNGAQLTVGSGATLYVGGGFENKSGSTLLNNGTVQVTGDVTNAGTVDAAGTGTLSLTGTTNQTLTAGGASFYNLTVDKATAGNNRVDVPADVTVTNQLTLTNGIVLTAQAAAVKLPNSATLVGESAGRYVKGNLQVIRTGVNGSSDVVFPGGLTLNPNTNNFGTVTVTRTAGLNTAGVSYGTDPANTNNPKGIDRIWQIAAGSAPASNKPVTVTLAWVSDDDNGNTNLSQSRMWRGPAASGPWAPLNAPADANSRSLSAQSGALGFFTVSNLANPLPVELLDFTAERRGSDALLRWATASETNNVGFEVEVSADGRAFQRLRMVNGHGTTTQRHDYQYLDPQIARYATDLVYYRLRQIDNDGKQTLSPVRTVRIEGVGFGVQALANPFGNEGLNVQVSTKTAGPATLSLHDAIGRVLLASKQELSAGSTTLLLSGAAQLPVGVYFLTVRQGKQVATLKVVRE